MMPQMRLTSPGISANAPITKTELEQHPSPVVSLKRCCHRPVRARRVAVELIDPRCALEVVPRDLHVPRRDRWLVLAVVGVGCLGLDLAQWIFAAFYCGAAPSQSKVAGFLCTGAIGFLS